MLPNRISSLRKYLKNIHNPINWYDFRSLQSSMCRNTTPMERRLHKNDISHINIVWVHINLHRPTIIYKIVEPPPDFQFICPCFPPPPSQCCSTTKSCQITRVISIRYFFQNNIDMGERGDEKFIFFWGGSTIL